MLACQGEILALDFESTGTVADYPNEPWQLGMVILAGGRVQPDRHFSTLLHIGDRPFSPYAPGQHHQRRDELARAPTLSELWPQLQDWWLGRPLAAHNCSVEQGFVQATAPLHRFGPWIDTLRLARYAYPQLASHALEDLLRELNLLARCGQLCPGLAPHDALFDAVGAALLLEHFLALPGWRELDAAALANVHPREYHTQVAVRGRRQRARDWQDPC